MQPPFESSEREWTSPVFAASVAEQTTLLDNANRQYLFASGLRKILFLSLLEKTAGNQLGLWICVMKALALQLLQLVYPFRWRLDGHKLACLGLLLWLLGNLGDFCCVLLDLYLESLHS